MQDGLEKLVADPGAADESEGAQVGGVLSEKHERGGRDFRVSRNSQDFVDTDKELDNISELIVGGRQGDPEKINDEVFLEDRISHYEQWDEDNTMIAEMKVPLCSLIECNRLV